MQYIVAKVHMSTPNDDAAKLWITYSARHRCTVIIIGDLIETQLSVERTSKWRSPSRHRTAPRLAA